MLCGIVIPVRLIRYEKLLKKNAGKLGHGFIRRGGLPTQ